MSGKPRIPSSMHAAVRRLAKRGYGRKAIADKLQVSLYTVRKALDPDFVERERARQRLIDRSARRQDENYLAYQAAWSATTKRREQVRRYRAEWRKNKRAAAQEPPL